MSVPDDMAFPVPSGIRTPNDTLQLGLTKREYFAAKAMQAIGTSTSKGAWTAPDAPQVAQRAVVFADALMAELAKPVKP